MAIRGNSSVVVQVRSFQPEDMQQLLAASESPCVSIYLGTHRKHPEWKQDPVRFKSLLGQAEAEIASRHPSREGNEILAPLRRLLDDEEPWQHSLEGLAAFASPSMISAFRVPIPVPEMIVVGDTFHTKPLFRFLRSNSRYYALAVSQNAVSLYHGSSFGAERINLSGLPTDLTAALGVTAVDEYERGLAAHSGGPSGRIVHGRGPGKEDQKETLMKFFRAIDKGLHEYLRDERAPLILAAVKYYHPIYRETNTYPHLLEEGLEGNFERVSDDAIHAGAWPIVARESERRAAEWVERYRALASKGLAVEGVESVASATVQGRVRCVLVSEDGSARGRLDRATGEVAWGSEAGAMETDLLDDVGEEAWKRGAEIYVLPPALLPTSSPIAAVLRF